MELRPVVFNKKCDEAIKMDLENSKIIVTGGAGFIGSHLCEVLVNEGCKIIVIDNLSTGKMEYIKNLDVKFIKGDLRNPDFVLKNIKNVEMVFHLAANYSVKYSFENPIYDFENTFLTTLNILEAMRRNDIKNIVFTSSSTVYGEMEKFPIVENAETVPINNYGTSKLMSEKYIKTFSSLYGIRGLILRYANILGPRSEHGVIPDFVKKLKENQKELLILGNGLQKKSYLHIKDCIDATILCTKKINEKYNVFNVGSEEWITVNEIAKLVCDRLNLKGINFRYTGEERGWPGDVRKFLLDVSKLKNLGWKPKYDIENAITETVDWLKNRG
jgi:UDP-glucose 4-epimerase